MADDITQENGGWSNPRMMRHYTHTEAQAHRAAGNAVNEHIWKAGS